MAVVSTVVVPPTTREQWQTAGEGTDPSLVPVATQAKADINALLVDSQTAQAIIPVPIQCALLATTGAPLAVFADNAASNPGLQIQNAVSYGLAWNDAATQVAVANVVPIPLDCDVTKAMTIRALVSKSGATSGDATKLTITAKFLQPAALDDADSDHGGDSDSVVGNATAKTVTKLSLTIAANALTSTPAALILTYKPKNGTLGTDDFYMHAMWIEYTRLLMTS